MSGDQLFCLAVVVLLVVYALLDDLIDAWRDRGRCDPPKPPDVTP